MIQALSDFLNGLHHTGSVRYALREVRFSAAHRREQARHAQQAREARQAREQREREAHAAASFAQMPEVDA